jgi:N-acetylated-alpha-linked acidic dipeptidase
MAFPRPFALLALGALPFTTSRAGDPPILAGYSAPASRAERDWERQFQAIPDAARLRESLRRLSARPHHVGSPYDHDNAEWILAQFKSYGLDAHIETFDVLFPTPRERQVELVAPTRFTATLREPAIAVDPTSGQQSEQLPTYNAYSIDGDVTAPLVYVNYGVPADYDELAQHGISVKGAIVIARYGHSWRGIKPKVAAEHGAVGCLIYSDPTDDGYAAGETFPSGAFRPRDGVQRGSVMDMPTYPGDPLTPGIGSTPGAPRLALSDAKTLTKIPVLPISYGDAQPLLAALRGPVAPPAWRGALPITYRMGPGPARVHLRVRSNWDTKTLYDVIARIPGAQAPDEWVIRGNHHDAWVNGASDPLSGQVALLEEARALGALLAKGWKPRRTIIYCAWDGEEPGLLGSTEWVETHADDLRRHAVAYINTDANERGFLEMQGSHVLEHFLNGVARDITDPETSRSVWARQQARVIRFGSAHERADARTRADLRIDALGSGSDYSSFLQHLGIASANLQYDGESNGAGVYHSVYDDFYWYTHYADTGFVYGRALSQTIGTAVMRLADAQLIPYDFTNLAETVETYTGDLRTLLQAESDSIEERRRQLRDGVFAATADPQSTFVAPDSAPPAPHLDFAPLENGADALTRSAAAYDRALTALAADSTAYDGPAVSATNGVLLRSERALTSPQGLPGRPWYVHLLYAPGYYTGYGVKTVPGVREAIEQRQWALAETEIARVGAALRAEAALVDSATDRLSGR